MSFIDDVGGFFQDAGEVLATTGAGVVTGFATGGPLGAILGGAYGTAKGIYTKTSGGDFVRGIYQTAAPAAIIGLGVGGATGNAVASNTALAKDFGYTPTVGETLGVQTQTISSGLSGFFGTASSSAGLGGNVGTGAATGKGFSLGGLFGGAGDGLAKYAASGALLGLAGNLFNGGSKVPGLTIPGAPSTNSITSLFPAGLPSSGSGPAAPAPAPVQAGVSWPLLFAAAGLLITLLKDE